MLKPSQALQPLQKVEFLSDMDKTFKVTEIKYKPEKSIHFKPQSAGRKEYLKYNVSITSYQ